MGGANYECCLTVGAVGLRQCLEDGLQQQDGGQSNAAETRHAVATDTLVPLRAFYAGDGPSRTPESELRATCPPSHHSMHIIMKGCHAVNWNTSSECSSE